MDYSHVIKKIRNNISKSGTETNCKRYLKLGDHFIEWSHFRQAYLWDISTHPFPVHHQLSQDHIYLTSEAKMRNHLAEQILNEEMLHLMKLFQQSLGEGGSQLNSTVKLLENTSVLIRNCRDSRAITDPSDDRLQQNHAVMDFFVDWEKSIASNTNNKNKESFMISHQTRQDIISSILGFEELCKLESRLHPDSVEIISLSVAFLHSVSVLPSDYAFLLLTSSIYGPVIICGALEKDVWKYPTSMPV
jgi:hypothetical protein